MTIPVEETISEIKKLNSSSYDDNISVITSDLDLLYLAIGDMRSAMAIYYNIVHNLSMREIGEKLPRMTPLGPRLESVIINGCEEIREIPLSRRIVRNGTGISSTRVRMLLFKGIRFMKKRRNSWIVYESEKLNKLGETHEPLF